MFPDRVFLTGGRSGDVIKECHSEKNFRKIDKPNPNPIYCEAKPVSGTKRTFEGGMESPAKRSCSYAFKNLLEYWDGPAKFFSNQDFTLEKSHTYFKNATQLADSDEMDPDLDLDDKICLPLKTKQETSE